MENNSNLIRTCNTTRKIVKVIRILSFVAAALAPLIGIALAVPGLVNMENLTVEHTMTGSLIEYNVATLYMLISAAFVSLILLGIVFGLCEKVLGTVGNGETPFTEENVRRIKSIAILTAASSVAPNFVSQIVRLIMGDGNISLEVEISSLVMALVIWCVALIFQYGAVLQERDDETL